MIFFIMLSVGIIMIISLFITNNTATKVNNSILLGVTLPYSEIKNNKVVEIIDCYKKAYTRLLIIFGIIYIPCGLISYLSIQLFFLFTWVGALIYFNNKIFMEYNERLKILKANNNWFIGSKTLITIDTEVARLKDKMPISKLWFIPSIAITAIIIFLSLLNKDDYGNILLYLSFSCLIANLVFILIYRYYSKLRTIVYSEDSNVNLACNFIYKRYWTLGCVMASLIQSICTLLVYIILILCRATESLFLIVVIIPAITIILGAYSINNLVIKEKNKIINNASSCVYVDNDQYWNGDVYNNPYDKRATVEKRVGYGITYNMATLKGKIYNYGGIAFTVIVISMVGVMTLVFDFTKLDVQVSDDTIKIQAPVYGVTFDKANLEKVEMVDNIEVIARTNGVGAESYSLGEFTVKEYGKSKLFVYSKDDSSYIHLVVNGDDIFIKGETKEETKLYYNKLNKY